VIKDLRCICALAVKGRVRNRRSTSSAPRYKQKRSAPPKRSKSTKTTAAILTFCFFVAPFCLSLCLSPCLAFADPWHGSWHASYFAFPPTHFFLSSHTRISAQPSCHTYVSFCFKFGRLPGRLGGNRKIKRPASIGRLTGARRCWKAMLKAIDPSESTASSVVDAPPPQFKG
jgi:hypothetical protein